MKKATLLFAACTGLTVFSCEKNEVIDSSTEGNIITISAVMDDELVTKGDYEISGSKATFTWTDDDEFYRIVRVDNGDGTYGNYNHYTYNYSSGSGSSVNFTGSSVGAGYADLGFALYPSFKYRDNTGAGLDYKHSNTGFYLVLGNTIAYNASNPLKNVVPMMGVKDENTYTFKPLTGVIAINLANIPITATSVTLSTTDGGLSGQSARFCDKTNTLGSSDILGFLGPETLGLRKPWLPGTSKKYTFSAASFSTATFYFPIATSYAANGSSSPYTNFTITVKDSEDTTLKTISATGLNITVNRSEIVVLPTINCNYAGTGFTPSLTGDPSDIKAYYTLDKGTVTTVRAAAISTNSKTALDTAIPNSTSGTDVYAATSIGDAITVASGFSDSGRYYIGFKAYNGTTEVGYKIISTPVYYLKATDKAKLIKTHTMSYANGNGGAMTYGTMTLSMCADFTKGQIVLDDFDGLTSTSSTSRLSNSHTFFKAMKNGGTYWMGGDTSGYPFTNKATNVYNGNTYYGILSEGTLTFATNLDYPLFNYSVDGNAEHTSKIILFSNAASTSDGPTGLSFNYDGTNLNVVEKYVVVRFIGWFYNGSTITNSGGKASQPYASDVTITL